MKRSLWIGLIVGLLLASPFVSNTPEKARAQNCNSTSSCASQLQKLKKDREIADQKREASKQQAQNLQGVVSDLQEDIAYTHERIKNTEEQVRLTDEILSKLNSDISLLEKKLSSAYVSLYELSRTNKQQVVLQSSLNESISQAQYLQAIQAQLQKEIGALELNKKERETQKADLEKLKQQLSDEKSSLSSKKSQQSYLLSVAQSNVSYYQGLSAEIQKKIATVERQLSTLIAQQSWGSDIMSANQGSWYYSQLSYPNVYLGDSPYTVAQYGCLITSIAMVSTFYGERVTPPQIAQYPGNFNSEGYLVRQPPSPISFSSMSTSSINWTRLNSEIDAGKPVIVSIYIPSVGAINSDGSSHFIVIYGRTGGKYLMHDPLGNNRSYAAKYVKSMKLIRN